MITNKYIIATKETLEELTKEYTSKGITVFTVPKGDGYLIRIDWSLN